MKNCLLFVVRAGLSVLLLAALGSCAVFHPYRMPTPKPSPEFVAQQKAEAAARKKREPLSLLKKFKKKPAVDTEEAATDVSTPSGAPVVAATDVVPEARTLPERPTVKYDKQGLMKKPKLMRRRKNKPAPKPFRPWQSVRHFFAFKFHDKPDYRPDRRPAAPAPEPDAAPDVAPAAAPAPDVKP